MRPARAAWYLGGGILLAGWLASAAGVGRPSIPQLPPRSAEALQLDAVASGVQTQVSRLRKRLAVAPAPQAAIRNPFAFGSRETLPSVDTPKATVGRADSVTPPPIDLAPEPDLVLLGLAEDGSTRTALIGSGEELLMATEGQTVAGRYRVAKVGADAIELIDLSTGTTRRLFLKSQALLP